MRSASVSSVFKPAIIASVGTIAVAALMFGAALTVAPQRAAALPAYAQQTGKPCGACHQNPAGGGKLTAAGQAFQKSHK